METPYIDCMNVWLELLLNASGEQLKSILTGKSYYLNYVVIGRWNCPFHLVNIITHGMEVNSLILS